MFVVNVMECSTIHVELRIERYVVDKKDRKISITTHNKSTTMFQKSQFLYQNPVF